MLRIYRRATLFLSGLLVFPIVGAAQAWVPGKGEGTVTVALQLMMENTTGTGKIFASTLGIT